MADSLKQHLEKIFENQRADIAELQKMIVEKRAGNLEWDEEWKIAKKPTNNVQKELYHITARCLRQSVGEPWDALGRRNVMIAAKIASEENEIKELDRQMKQDIHSAFQFGECIGNEDFDEENVALKNDVYALKRPINDFEVEILEWENSNAKIIKQMHQTRQEFTLFMKDFRKLKNANLDEKNPNILARIEKEEVDVEKCRIEYNDLENATNKIFEKMTFLNQG